MQLRIVYGDGTSSVYLSGTSPVQECAYFPQAPQPDENGELAQEVSETCEVLLIGTAANIRATTTNIERYFELARVRRRSQTGSKVYVEYQAVASGDWYRSEILAGTLQWSDNPALRRLSDTTPKVVISLHWTRRFFWEYACSNADNYATPQISLTSPSDASPTTNYVTLYNNDDATANTNWIGIAAAQVVGTLPAPLMLEIVQADVTARAWRELYLCNNVWAAPTTVSGFLLGSAAVDGDTASWTGSSAHTTQRFIWQLTSAQLAAFAGRYFRILLAPAVGTYWGNTYVKAWIKSYVSTVYTTLWEGDEVYAANTSSILDLGAAPVPPGGYDVGLAQAALVITCRSSATTTVQADFAALMPVDWGQYRRVHQLGYNTEQNDALVDDGIEGTVYLKDDSDSKHWLIMSAEGTPLHVWPNQTQRLRVLINGTSWQPSWTMQAKAYCRARRLAV